MPDDHWTKNFLNAREFFLQVLCVTCSFSVTSTYVSLLKTRLPRHDLYIVNVFLVGLKKWWVTLKWEV